MTKGVIYDWEKDLSIQCLTTMIAIKMFAPKKKVTQCTKLFTARGGASDN